MYPCKYWHKKIKLYHLKKSNGIFISYLFDIHHHSFKNTWTCFPGGLVVKYLPANAGDMGGSHLLWNNQARTTQLLSQHSRASELQPLSPHAETTEAWMPRAHALQQEKLLQWETWGPKPESSPAHSSSNEDPAQP